MKTFLLLGFLLNSVSVLSHGICCSYGADEYAVFDIKTTYNHYIFIPYVKLHSAEILLGGSGGQTSDWGPWPSFRTAPGYFPQTGAVLRVGKSPQSEVSPHWSLKTKFLLWDKNLVIMTPGPPKVEVLELSLRVHSTLKAQNSRTFQGLSST